jgi:hypothetical protein
VNDDEVKRILRGIHIAYPWATKAWETMMEEVLPLWRMGIGDLPFPVVSKVLQTWIQNEERPPSIAQLRTETAKAVYQLPTPGSALAQAKAFVKNGEVGRCPKIIQHALDKMGRPRQVRTLSDFAFEKAFQEVWKEVEKEAQAAVLENISMVVSGRAHELPAMTHLALTAESSNLQPVVES